jgi:putative thioredoxin
MALDVTDATFEAQVVQRSLTTPVLVDLWAPWCGPCQTLGPILERVCDATGGQVVLAKVNIDENPGIAQAFRVQSIPAVYALRDGQIVDGFMGALPEHQVQQFVAALLPTESQQVIAALLEAGDETSLWSALELDPANEAVIVALAELLVASDRSDEALALLARIPETDVVRVVAAKARVGREPDDDYSAELDGLLDLVKHDDEARQRFVDLLELMGPHDPRTAAYRKKLTARLF